MTPRDTTTYYLLALPRTRTTPKSLAADLNEEFERPARHDGR